MKIRLILNNGEATGEIDDTRTGRDLIDLLPVTVQTAELFGREQAGPLPRDLVDAVQGQLTYAVGEIGYWPPTHDIVFFFADTQGGNDIPAPGNVHLGVVTAGLHLLAGAGESLSVTIERV